MTTLPVTIVRPDVTATELQRQHRDEDAQALSAVDAARDRIAELGERLQGCSACSAPGSVCDACRVDIGLEAKWERRLADALEECKRRGLWCVVCRSEKPRWQVEGSVCAECRDEQSSEEDT
jgi:hypothetical protein